MKMGLVLFLVISLLLPTASPTKDTNSSLCSSILQEDERQYQFSNSTGINMILHHVHGPCSPVKNATRLPLADLLKRDEARAKSLSDRVITKQESPAAVTAASSSQQQKSVAIPLNSGVSIGVGNYIVKIGLGTPAQYFAVVMDTGSTFSWVQCEPCLGYCHPQVGRKFNPDTSSTHKYSSCAAPECSALESATHAAPRCSRSKKCVYASAYGDGSFSVGYLSKDELTIAPSQTSPAFAFGCGQDNEGLFGYSAGLIGLSRNKLSFLSQLSSKYGYVFSYCLPTPRSTGMLSIGDQSTYNPSIFKFTPMYSDRREPSLYFLRMTGITVAGKLLPLSSQVYSQTPIIIDSGTVITRLPMSIYTAFRTAFVKAMGGTYKKAPGFALFDTCFGGSMRGMRVPEVGLVFQGGSEMKLPAGNTVIQVEKGRTCLAFAGTSRVGIIANHQQQTFTVVYDIPHLRIGFAAGGCR